MKDRPILFSGPMVRAVLDGTKTQTRRIVKADFTHEPHGVKNAKWYIRRRGRCWDSYETSGELIAKHCPYGQPGDKLWVRETFAEGGVRNGDDVRVVYRADDSGVPYDKWTPSIFMPRAFSRITLEIKAVRVERLQDITAGDVISEGVWPRDWTMCNNNWQRKWIELWDGINGKAHPWESNPWVWVLEFTRVDQ